MEVLFKNTYIQTEDWVKAVNKLSLFHRPIPVVLHSFYLLILIWAVYKVIFLRIIDVLLFFIPTWWLILVVALYFKMNKIALQRSMELYGRNAAVISEVTEDCVKQVYDNGSLLQMHFDTIKRGYLRGNYIFLVSKAGICHTFGRKGFLIGNEEDFLHFLRGKGIKIK